MIPLFIAAAVVLCAIGAGAYVVVMAPIRSKDQVAKLRDELDFANEKLNEAEEIGNFGSFLWNFENPSSSFWSQHMFALCGLVLRKATPSINDMVQTSHVEDRGRLAAAWEKAQKQPGVFAFTFRSVALSGQVRYLSVRGVTTLYDSKKPRMIQGVAHDISKDMEINKAKTEFVSLASHQLKTPLTAIRWLSEALMTGGVGEMSPQQKEYVGKIQEADLRMMAMVNDLLNVSRIDLGTFMVRREDIDITALAQGVIEEQQHTAVAKPLSLTLSCDPGLPHINGDTTMVRMIFQNLISNAIKYTPKNGSVVCEVTTAGATRETIFIRVKDTGIGIPKAEQSRIFEKMRRASNAEALEPDGNGLGLYLVKSIVEKAGGGITFESIEGKGTTFYVSLPLVWKDAEKT